MFRNYFEKMFFHVMDDITYYFNRKVTHDLKCPKKKKECF